MSQSRKHSMHPPQSPATSDERREYFRNAVTALARRDARGFSLVYSQVAKAVEGVVARQVQPAHDAQDVVQQVFMKLFARSHEFDPGRGDAISWALTIASYEVRTRRQQHRRSRETCSDDLSNEAAAESRSPEALAISKDLQHAAQSILAELPPQDANILLCEAQDTSSRAKSALERKRLERARVRLRLSWERRFGS